MRRSIKGQICGTAQTAAEVIAAGGDIGRNIRIVSEQEAEAADFVVCVRADDPTPFDDNVFADCKLCGARIQHRPHAPRRPKKICVQCFAEGKDHAPNSP